MPGLLFTPETARENAAKSVQARREKAERAKSDAIIAAQTRSESPLNPLPTDPYAKARLIRVRTHLDRLDDLIQSETDPAKLDRLAAAADKLSQQECYLSGRPRPGIRRVSSRDSQQQQPLPPPSEPS